MGKLICKDKKILTLLKGDPDFRSVMVGNVSVCNLIL